MTLRRPLVSFGGKLYQIPSGDYLLPSCVLAREKLLAARTYYVRTDGSDSNTGLANTSGGAFLTVQKAINIAKTLDNGGYDITIQVNKSTVTEAVIMDGPVIGSGKLYLLGDTATPSNVAWTTANNHNIYLSGAARINIGGFLFSTTGSGCCLLANGAGTQIYVSHPVRFGACAEAHCWAFSGGNVNIRAPLTVSGSAQWHVLSSAIGVADIQGVSITLTGTPAFSSAFACSREGGLSLLGYNTFTGSATGSRYQAISGGGVSVNGAGANYLPGNTAGTTADTGWYA